MDLQVQASKATIMDGYKNKKLYSVNDIKYAKSYQKIVDPTPSSDSINGWKRVNATQWVKDLNKYVNNNYDRVTELMHLFTNKTINRLQDLDIRVGDSGDFYDNTAGKVIGFNSVKILIAEEMDEKYKRDCDKIDYPLPKTTECREIVEVVLLEYKDFAIKQLILHIEGKPIDPSLGIITEPIKKKKNGI